MGEPGVSWGRRRCRRWCEGRRESIRGGKEAVGGGGGEGEGEGERMKMKMKMRRGKEGKGEDERRGR